MGTKYEVKIDAFEGPLDLLLHLINRYEIDIYDIPVAEITEQYMAYIQTMQQLELDVASEYLVMAATLIALKSQMLLPNQEVDVEDDDYEEDPREELIQRLIQYRKFKGAAEQLKERELDKNQIYTRPPANLEQYMSEPSTVQNFGEVSMFDLLSALQKLFQRKKWEQPLETRIHKQEIPIDQRMEQILNLVKESSGGVSFQQLFPYKVKSHIVVTFISILELMKSRKVMCQQDENFADIILYQMKEHD
ncbi:segregation/condensation protein A [Salirhabdus salicampi]|uniref:segregation/condensation protein A n=1 Tax=Salirhabdus salicampi TaxID=476102 RepID=UPI0020C512C2|nr:segregation/condensation protein A [Salirhabdus salicampi]MCP8616747.1 segregation/condensation protein A [Salirhabdus salicampi]